MGRYYVIENDAFSHYRMRYYTSTIPMRSIPSDEGVLNWYFAWKSVA